MAKAEYKSAVRSRTLIKRAFAKLIHEKDISKITVTDIIQEAEISRATFYAHYPDVHSLLEQIMNEEISAIAANFENQKAIQSLEDPTSFFRQMCRYIERDMDYYRMLILSRHLSDNFVARFIDIFAEDLINVLTDLPFFHTKDEAVSYLTYVSAGAKNVLYLWVAGDIKLSADEISDFLGNMMNSTSLIFLNEKKQ